MKLSLYPKALRYALNRWLERGEIYYALNRLDQNMKSYLPWWSGFFVEVGANNGVAQSNTCYFERSRNWKGLLIEPIPELAEQCRKNRPNSIVEQCALVGPDYPDAAIDMYYGNLMSVVAGAKQTEDELQTHLERAKKCQNIETHSLRVPVCTLSALLDKHKVKKIDFMSLASHRVFKSWLGDVLSVEQAV